MDNPFEFSEAMGQIILDGLPQPNQAEGSIFTTMDDFSGTSFFDVNAQDWNPFDFNQQTDPQSPAALPAPEGTVAGASGAFSLVGDSTTSYGHAWDSFCPPTGFGPMNLDPSAAAPRSPGDYCPPFELGTRPSEAQQRGVQRDHYTMLQGIPTQPRPSFTTWNLSTGQQLEAADCAQDEESAQSWPCPWVEAKAFLGWDDEKFLVARYGLKPCEKVFTRFDSLQRHMKTHRATRHRPTGKFACPWYCRDHGWSTFERKDHLNQHLRKIHKYTPFQCPVDDCEHVGAKGWYREYQRKAHQMDVHGELRGEELAIMNAKIDAKVAQTMPSGKKK